ncbi:hypothetical protein EVAR_10646_1 [Eumeta japonica]|uniref:Uncharacterized protein n=1 Tax=Eumeta variegata TaxID=151549 RepID=A0A4C1U7Q8_EUMVA|nr:hypothetical protein EVAR_10646_1 [Eumeta japonica]
MWFSHGREIAFWFRSIYIYQCGSPRAAEPGRSRSCGWASVAAAVAPRDGALTLCPAAPEPVGAGPGVSAQVGVPPLRRRSRRPQGRSASAAAAPRCRGSMGVLR